MLLNQFNSNQLKYEVHSLQPSFEYIQVNQVHGNVVLTCSDASAQKDADGIICLCHNCTLAIKTADCLPIAIFGEKGHALIHAGWRGLAQEIIKSKILEDISPKLFYIGPHIMEDSYEVSSDFFANFPEIAPIMNNGKFYFSLFEVAKKQILDKYPSVKVEQSGICTFKDQSYNSYRRNQTTNRNWNILKKG